MAAVTTTAEHTRLEQSAKREANWQRWGPYLSERQWGTVREDYSADGNVWESFTHDEARSRAYRWGEDGLLGWTDRECRLSFAVAVWNEQDPILKERLFGLTGPEGNHGEDVKELYHYVDCLPTNAYAKGLYRYPQAAFPYEPLVRENARRGKHEDEYEITDTGVFDDGRYFDVEVEYAKGSPNDTLIRITVTNRGPDAAPLHVLPTLWHRNTWVWGCEHEGCHTKPDMRAEGGDGRVARVVTDHETLGRFAWAAGPHPDTGEAPELLFTDNHTNNQRLYGARNAGPFVKDAFHERVIRGDTSAVNPKRFGTKAAAWYRFEVPAGGSKVLRLRLCAAEDEKKVAKKVSDTFSDDAFDAVFDRRIAEAEAFYDTVIDADTPDDQRRVARQAYAGLLWTKQFYHYVVAAWLEGDPNMPPPPPPDHRGEVRNGDWASHLFNRDVISMPDKWEYPWYAAWDLAFHMIPMCRIDPHFAKKQLGLFLREWYMHPNGQLPAYEFAFSDVNPPVHAWAVWRVYKMTAPRGKRDTSWLASCFQKLLLNFTWWVNRKDPDGHHVFGGGFLGLDNIGVFDRSRPLPGGGRLTQADATAWMAFYCGTMLSMALELAKTDRAYADMASKFFEHFVAIADAINDLGGHGLWDDEDGFYYDQLLRGDGHDGEALKVRSLVGLMPLIAVEVLKQSDIDALPGFKKRTEWFLEYRKDLADQIAFLDRDGEDGGRDRLLLLAMPNEARLRSVLRYLLDENEFLSPYGVRSLSKFHDEHPYRLWSEGETHEVRYQPGESRSGMFGGNSNWRGPIWFPINYLLIEALQRYHRYYGEGFKVECPTGSGQMKTLHEAAAEIEQRLEALFCLHDGEGRPCHAGDPHWNGTLDAEDVLLFHEYFHAETGRGLGASHQTGWTALITELINELARR